MKSERHADRMALFWASVGDCAKAPVVKAPVAAAKSAAASKAVRVDACFNVLNIGVNSCPVGNADDLLKVMQTIVAGDAACGIIGRFSLYRK
ncbi:hypothetical protein [Bradyrhizobium sp. KB893862 SZCCT0404]|uniref:hypothetical protein n=1 Tax=Bradyrhizobium sp. KB893862 SZCCT0404 TaxID=2807672 RepID=UPI0020133C5F|nr:hypothetical protein [Bradyrhizobium sp. KB893862 SZCCT0404]